MVSAAGQDQAAHAAFERALAWQGTDEHHDQKALVVRRGDSRNAECPEHEASSALPDLRSTVQGVLSLLIGLAVDRGLVRGVAEPFCCYLPRLSVGMKEHGWG
jgi:hypothetical protein